MSDPIVEVGFSVVGAIGIALLLYSLGLDVGAEKGRKRGFREGWLAGIDYERNRMAEKEKR